MGVDNAEIVIDGLVEDHVVNVGVYYFTHCAQSFDTVYVDVLEDLVYFVRPHFNFVDKHSKEFNNLWVLEVNTKIQAVKEGHGIQLYVVTVFRYDLNDFLVQLLLFVRLFLSQAIGLFKAIEGLVMEVDLSTELHEVLILDVLVDVEHNLVLQS